MPPAHAQETVVWDPNQSTAGTGGSGSWNTFNSFWSGSGGFQPWVDGDSAIFEGTAGTVTLGESLSALGLRFTTTGYIINGGGNTLTLVADSGPPPTPPSVYVSSGVTAVVAAPIAGTAGLTKFESGTLILSGANTFIGLTVVLTGTLQIGNGGTTGRIIGDVLNNATLTFNRSDAATHAFVITGTGSLVQAGTGGLTLTANNSYNGTTAISAGTLSIGSGGANGALGTPGFTGGVFVAVGDVNGDGVADILTGAGAGGGPHVRAFSLAGGGLTELASFFAYDPAFAGGVSIAAGDLTGDGVAEIVTGAGAGGAPHVRAFSLASGEPVELASFFAYDAAFTGGISIAVGDVSGDGVADISPGPGLAAGRKSGRSAWPAAV